MSNDEEVKKYLPYDVLASIPDQILKARDPKQQFTKKDARLVHDALLIKFWLSMPCLKPKQIREARICGATENVFKGTLNPRPDVAVPAWAAEECRRNPKSELWQVRFTPEEKSGRPIHFVLPKQLIPLLEKYLELHRPLLAGGNDPGTLFLGRRGPLSTRQLNRSIGELTARFGGCKIVPGAVREAVARKWLSVHPDDHITLSEILGLRNVATFWNSYVQSRGMCSFEDLL